MRLTPSNPGTVFPIRKKLLPGRPGGAPYSFSRHVAEPYFSAASSRARASKDGLMGAVSIRRANPAATRLAMSEGHAQC